jgi:Lrp/AsnC family transcriptional regulator for asnA, asnC and gidA
LTFFEKNIVSHKVPAILAGCKDAKILDDEFDHAPFSFQSYVPLFRSRTSYMTENIKIDSIDRRILRLLSEKGRISFLEVARECGMSGAAIHQRVAKLEQQGIIAGYSVKLSPENLGFSTCAYVGVFLEKAIMYHSVVAELEKISEIVECHYTTGNYAIFLKVYCRNNQHLMEILNGMIQTIPGVASTETFISLEHGIMRDVQP